MRRATVLAIALLMLGATSQPARDLPPTYVCARADGAIEVDGRLDDEPWGSAAWTLDFIDIVGTGKPLPTLRTRAKMLWDEQFLYVAADIVEPNVAATIRQRDQQLYREQAFELFLDPGGDGRDYIELQVNPLNTVCDLAMDKPYRDRGKANVAFDLQGLRCAVRVEGTVNEPSDADTGWSVELAIPWAAIAKLSDGMVVPPHDGERWRANLARMRPADAAPNAGAKVRRSVWVWSAQGAANMHLPERWGWVEFAAAKPDAKHDVKHDAKPRKSKVPDASVLRRSR